MSQKVLSLSILALLSFFSIVAALALPVNSSSFLGSSSAANCPANQTVNFVTEPIPESFNYLNPSGDSTFYIGSIEYLSLTPFPLEPNGSLDWNDSLTNWITSNSNYTQWTFHIRPGATWSNGTAVDASDIATWVTPGYALDPQYDFVGLHTEITGVKIVNSDTATILLNQSDAQLPNRISEYYYAPLVSPTDVAQGPNATLFGTGTADGPWYLSNYVSGSTSAVMLPNPNWPGVKPTACAIDLTFVENSAEMIPYLVSGQADFAGPLVFGNIAALQGHHNIKLHSLNGTFGEDMVYNITQYPYNMTAFRQALVYAINSSSIVQQSEFGFGVPANNAQGEVPESVAFYSSNQTQYAYNVSESLTLLHSIGFTGGGSSSTPLRFPNGTAMSVTVYTDSNKAWDPNVAIQVAGFLSNLGISTQTQTLTTQNLASDYASNAFNIRSGLVIYSSGGPYYFQPWIDGQQGCNIMGTPGCYGWQATAASDGQTHWEYPPSADVEYQSNLTALNNTPLTNITGEKHYLDNIQSLNSQYLPAIMLSYPDEIFAYNTQRWTNWPSYYFITGGQFNESIFGALKPSGSSTNTTTSPVITSSSQQSSTSSSQAVSSSLATTSSSPQTSTSSQISTTSTTTSSGSGTIEIAAVIIVVIIVIIGIAAYVLRRKPPAAPAAPAAPPA